MATKLKFNRKFGKKILALLLSVLTVFTCITPVMSVLADSSIKDVWSSGGMAHHRLEIDGKDALCCYKATLLFILYMPPLIYFTFCFCVCFHIVCLLL